MRKEYSIMMKTPQQ